MTLDIHEEGTMGMDELSKDKGHEERTRVLIVEDEDAVREPMVEYLRYKGIDADGVPDGQSGLDTLGVERYMVCVVDLLMPKMGGEEFILKAKEINPALKFVVVTGKGMPFQNEYRPLLNIPGVVAILQKPFPLEKLYETVLQAL